MTKFIFITGGVVSSLGKGIIGASLGRLLRSKGFSVAIQKFDPYINVDPGTMSPFQHGEVFVTDDGAETDLDLGHYERFIDANFSQISNVTSGSVYQTVIKKERRGDYLGATVQTIPHITNEIKSRIFKAQKYFQTDFQIIEIGGTIGDIESLPFIEAIRQFKAEIGIGNAINIHCTLLPYLPTSGELKTKPSQHSVNVLRSYGLQPEVLVCRTSKSIPKTEKEKLALFCSVPKEAVIECRDMKSIYEVPLALDEQHFAEVVLKLLQTDDRETNLDSWKQLVDKIKNPKKTVKIAIAGKYTKLSDAYISVVESLKHAGYKNDAKIEIKWINSEDCNDYSQCKSSFKDVQGLVVPGGFGVRGIEGKLNAIRYARENNLPFLGLCLGMQCAVIEYARNVVGLKGANSKEFELLWYLMTNAGNLPQLLGPGQDFMACVVGAGMIGLGIGLVFSANGSTGGTDIIAWIINKYRDVSLGRMMMYLDIIIISSCYFIFHDWRRVLFGFVVLFIMSIVIDYVINTNRQSVQFLIFSRKYNDIAEGISTKIDRGVTLLDGKCCW